MTNQSILPRGGFWTSKGYSSCKPRYPLSEKFSNHKYDSNYDKYDSFFVKNMILISHEKYDSTKTIHFLPENMSPINCQDYGNGIDIVHLFCPDKSFQDTIVIEKIILGRRKAMLVISSILPPFKICIFAYILLLMDL